MKKNISWGQWVPLITFLIIVLGFSIASESFLTARNLTNLIRQISVNAILASGMTMIILLGAIDLSIGSLLAFGGVVGGLLQVFAGLNNQSWLGAAVSMLGVLALCGSVGAFSGFFVSKFKMPSFVVTLGVLVIARGLALILSQGSKISPLSLEYRLAGTSFVPPTESMILLGLVALLASAYFAVKRQDRWILRFAATWVLVGLSMWIFSHEGIPVPVLIMAFVFGFISFVLSRTSFGRKVYAVGGNPEAARLCGIRVSGVYFWSFVTMGILVGLASIIESGRIDAGDPNAGNLYELDAIAAVVIGGTSLQGGVGSVKGTLLGSFLIGTLNNGMSLLNVPTNFQMVIKGVIIVLAVLSDTLSKGSEK